MFDNSVQYIGTAIAICLLIWVGVSGWKHLRREQDVREKRNQKDSRAHRSEVRFLVQEKIHSALWDLWYTRQISTEDYLRWCKIIGEKLNWVDLLPYFPRSRNELKKNIRARLDNRHLVYAVVPLPGEPKEDFSAYLLANFGKPTERST